MIELKKRITAKKCAAKGCKHDASHAWNVATYGILDTKKDEVGLCAEHYAVVYEAYTAAAPATVEAPAEEAPTVEAAADEAPVQNLEMPPAEAIAATTLAEAQRNTAWIQGELDFLRDFRIANKEQLVVAGGFLRQIKALSLSMQKERNDATGKLTEVVRTIQSWFRPGLQSLATAEKLLKDEIKRFDTECRQLQAEAMTEAKAALEAGDQEAVSAANAKVQAATTEVPEGLSMRERWTFEVVDLEQVPRKWLILDTAKVGEYVRKQKDAAEIPGLRVFNDPSIAVRSA